MQEFWDRITHGYAKIKEADISIYQERLEKEVSAIEKANLVPFFMRIHDIVRYCKKNDIQIGVGRGSACNSLVCFLLGITNVDPIRHNLMFERFFSLERKGDIDIDMDVQSSKHKQLIEYAKTKGLSQFLNRKEESFEEFLETYLKSVSLSLLDEDDKKKVLTAVKGMSFEEFQESDKSEVVLFRSLFKDFEFKPSIRTGINVSGLVNKENLPTAIFNGVEIVNHNGPELKAMGINKIDLLPSKLLDFFSEAQELGAKLRFEFDETTIKALEEKKLSGIFQMTDSFRGYIRQMNIHCFEELCNAIALHRPMALKSGVAQKYVDQDIFCEIDEITKDTRGLIIFQEQQNLVIAKEKECSLEDADKIRRSIKTDYTFNKGHAVAYALNICAHINLKYDYPEIFYGLALTYDKEKDLIKEMEHFDLSLGGYDINSLSNTYLAKEKILYHPFYFGKGIFEEVKRAGEFFDIEECYLRIREFVNNEQFEQLIHAGAFDKIHGITGPKQRIILAEKIERFFTLRKKDFEAESNKFFKTKETYKNMLDNKYPLFFNLLDYLTLSEVNCIGEAKNIVICGKIEEIYVRQAKNGEYLFVELSDETGTSNVKLWNDVFKKYKDILKPLNVVAITCAASEYKNIFSLSSHKATKIVKL